MKVMGIETKNAHYTNALKQPNNSVHGLWQNEIEGGL